MPCCTSIDHRNIRSYIELFWITSSIAIALLLTISIALIVLIRKMFIAKAIRKEFIRRMKLNERYEFDYIQLLWAVEEANIEIYYDKQIGKGTQSLVFSG